MYSENTVGCNFYVFFSFFLSLEQVVGSNKECLTEGYYLALRGRSLSYPFVVLSSFMMQQFGRFMGFHINKEGGVLFLRLSSGPAEDFLGEKILVCFDFIRVAECSRKTFFIIYLVPSFPLGSLYLTCSFGGTWPPCFEAGKYIV